MGCKKFAPFVLIGPLFKYSCNWIKRFKRHLYSSELRYLSAMAFETRLLFLNVNQQLILWNFFFECKYFFFIISIFSLSLPNSSYARHFQNIREMNPSILQGTPLPWLLHWFPRNLGYSYTSTIQDGCEKLGKTTVRYSVTWFLLPEDLCYSIVCMSKFWKILSRSGSGYFFPPLLKSNLKIWCFPWARKIRFGILMTLLPSFWLLSSSVIINVWILFL